jgi:hypothetical protein
LVLVPLACDDNAERSSERRSRVRPRTLGPLESAARRWLDALYARGAPVAGPVLVVGARSSRVEVVVEWAGVTPLTPSFPDDET